VEITYPSPHASKRRKIDRLGAIERALHRWQRIFEPACAIEQHDLLMTTNASVREALFERGISGSGLRAEQKALRARDLVERGRDFAVRTRNRKAAALAHRPQDQEIADRLRHADAAGDCLRILPARSMLGAGLERTYHGGAAGRLHGHHARPFAVNEADRLQFSEGFPHPDQASAAASRIEDYVRELPAELLGEFQTHGLLSLDPIGLLEG